VKYTSTNGALENNRAMMVVKFCLWVVRGFSGRKEIGVLATKLLDEAVVGRVFPEILVLDEM
jgi:hypothetical protein